MVGSSGDINVPGRDGALVLVVPACKEEVWVEVSGCAFAASCLQNFESWSVHKQNLEVEVMSGMRPFWGSESDINLFFVEIVSESNQNKQ